MHRRTVGGAKAVHRREQGGGSHAGGDAPGEGPVERDVEAQRDNRDGAPVPGQQLGSAFLFLDFASSTLKGKESQKFLFVLRNSFLFRGYPLPRTF